MQKLNSFKRRAALAGAVFSAAAALIPSVLRAQSANLVRRKRTPTEIEGPFYPLAFPADSDNDLTQIGGATTQAIGERLQINGRVLLEDGRAVTGARVEIWQVDHAGSYIHPAGASAAAPRDAGFQGFGATLTDVDGRYQFTTIKPPPYETRPAHIHFKVKRAGSADFTTQMFFEGANKESGFVGLFYRPLDRWAAERPLLTVRITPGLNGAPLVAVFDIVL